MPAKAKFLLRPDNRTLVLEFSLITPRHEQVCAMYQEAAANGTLHEATYPARYEFFSLTILRGKSDDMSETLNRKEWKAVQTKIAKMEAVDINLPLSVVGLSLEPDLNVST